MSLVKGKDRVLDSVFFTGIMCVSGNLHPQITRGKSETQVDGEAWGSYWANLFLICFSS